MDQKDAATSGWRRHFRRRWFLGGLLTGGLLGGLAAASFNVFSHPGQFGGWGRHGHGMCAGTGADVSSRAERAEFAADWMLNRIGADEAQRAQVKAILQGALADLAQTREEHCRNRDAFMQALQAPALDRAALDGLRRTELQLADRASARMLQAVADAAEVLTPEQRAQLAEHLARMRR